MSRLSILLVAVSSSLPSAVAAQEPAPAPATEPPPAASRSADAPLLAGYDKGFFIRDNDGQFEVRIGARVQGRYELEVVEGGDDDNRFSIPRARLTLQGHAFSESLKYKFQTDFGKGFVSLKDFYADYAFGPWLHLRAGQYKRPFSRQQITSSGSQSFVDRTINDKGFSAGRDIGLMAHNNYEKSPTFEYALGLFNGSGDKAVLAGDVVVDLADGDGEITAGSFGNVPDAFRPTVVLRLGYNHGGIKGYKEADLEGGGFRFAVAASGQADFNAAGRKDAGLKGELDFMVKAYGFSTTGGAYLASRQSDLRWTDQSYEAFGAQLQAGLVLAEHFQPVVRYAVLTPDGPDNDVQVITAGLSVYFFGHGFKWQTDGSAILDQGEDDPAYLIRSQLQLSF